MAILQKNVSCDWFTKFKNTKPCEILLVHTGKTWNNFVCQFKHFSKTLRECMFLLSFILWFNLTRLKFQTSGKELVFYFSYFRKLSWNAINKISYALKKTYWHYILYLYLNRNYKSNILQIFKKKLLQNGKNNSNLLKCRIENGDLKSKFWKRIRRALWFRYSRLPWKSNSETFCENLKKAKLFVYNFISVVETFTNLSWILVYFRKVISSWDFRRKKIETTVTNFANQ